ncbi:hypothetical protein D7X98_04035 [bacterium 1XD8-76]|nr:hypothetical protein D7X98_04035 [bacterium 1XD8-76]
MLNREEEIQHIQNAVWAMYKSYLKDHDMKSYNRKMGELSAEYSKKGDWQLLHFCNSLFVVWAPIIREFAIEFKSKSNTEAEGRDENV